MTQNLFQKLSGVLMVPIVIIPVAAVLMAVGFLLGDNAVLIGAGRAIIPQFLPLLFALAVVLGFCGGDAWAAVAATVGYAVTLAVAETVGGVEHLNLGALGGLAVGGVVAWIFNRAQHVQFPEYFGLFNGKRLVPTLAALAGLPLGWLAGVTWPAVIRGIEGVGHWAATAGATGALVYGALDRLLLPTGMHHVLNNLIEHQLGSYVDPATGMQYSGEIQRFLAGDPQAGLLMSGFYIFNNFSIPAMALAIGLTARPAHRRRVMGLMVTGLLTSVLTGITEPVEFAFIFAAPVLWVADILFAGLASFAAYALDVRHWGYALPMYLINLNASSNAWWIPILGVPFFLAQFGIFWLYIRLFRPAVPGQEPDDAAPAAAPGPAAGAAPAASLAARILAALGGPGNVRSVLACATRLRLDLADAALADAAALRALGAHGVVQVGNSGLQVVLGARAEPVAAELHRLLAAGAAAAAAAPGAPAPGAARAGAHAAIAVELLSPMSGQVVLLPELPDPVFSRRLAGDGAAVEPQDGRVLAPCAGRVVHVFPEGHAIGIEAAGGLEFLIHIGLDTVHLKGEGFRPAVAEGDRVQAGQLLVEFDLAALRAAGKAGVSPLVVTNMERVERLDVLAGGDVRAGVTPLLRVVLKPAP